MKPAWWVSMFALCGLTVASAGGAGAQAARRELVGFVREAGGAPVEGATVEIPGSSARTDAKGLFRLWTGALDTVTIAIHRIGYSGIEALLNARKGQWDTLVVEMDRTAQALKGVRVSGSPTRANGLRTFEERRAKGIGTFITREELAARNTLRLSDNFQTRRGVRLVRLGHNRNGVRFASYSGTRGTTCVPDIWLDGQRARGMEIDDIPANTVEAIELYESFALVPMEFSQGVQRVPCGTIVIWTRIPAKADP